MSRVSSAVAGKEEDHSWVTDHSIWHRITDDKTTHDHGQIPGFSFRSTARRSVGFSENSIRPISRALQVNGLYLGLKCGSIRRAPWKVGFLFSMFHTLKLFSGGSWNGRRPRRGVQRFSEPQTRPQIDRPIVAHLFHNSFHSIEYSQSKSWTSTAHMKKSGLRIHYYVLRRFKLGGLWRNVKTWKLKYTK